jgi:hypothetical protein
MRSKVATPTSALPARPERPVKYACPTNAPDGTIGYDRPLENYLDVSKAGQLMPSKPTNKVSAPRVPYVHRNTDHPFPYIALRHSGKRPRLPLPARPDLVLFPPLPS